MRRASSAWSGPRGSCEGNGPSPCLPGPLFAAVAEAVDRPGVVVEYERRAVAHYLDVPRPPPRRLALQPAFGEDLVFHRFAARDHDALDAIAGFLRPVPGTVFGDEDAVPVFHGELAARVEAHAQRRHMGAECHPRHPEFGAG